MYLSAAPELLDLPAVRRLLEVQVDMQLADLVAVLRLPKPYVRLHESMNLIAATQLFSLISGMSVLLYRANYEYLKNPTEAGLRFKGIVREHMPFTHPEDLRAGHAAEVMWTFARNPLAHSFGIGKDRASFPGYPAPPSVIRTSSLRKVWQVFTFAEHGNSLLATTSDRRGLRLQPLRIVSVTHAR